MIQEGDKYKRLYDIDEELISEYKKSTLALQKEITLMDSVLNYKDDVIQDKDLELKEQRKTHNRQKIKTALGSLGVGILIGIIAL